MERKVLLGPVHDSIGTANYEAGTYSNLKQWRRSQKGHHEEHHDTAILTLYKVTYVTNNSCRK